MKKLAKITITFSLPNIHPKYFVICGDEKYFDYDSYIEENPEYKYDAESVFKDAEFIYEDQLSDNCKKILNIVRQIKDIEGGFDIEVFKKMFDKHFFDLVNKVVIYQGSFEVYPEKKNIALIIDKENSNNVKYASITYNTESDDLSFKLYDNYLDAVLN